MEYEKLTGPAGHVPAGHLVLLGYGINGAVTLSVFESNGNAKGCISFHYRHPTSATPASGPCEYLPEGFCYGDITFRGGYEAAPYLLAGRDDAAWQIVEQWAEGRIET